MKSVSKHTVERSVVEQTLKGLKLLSQETHQKMKASKSKKFNLLETDTKLFLQINLNKIPIVEHSSVVKITIPHPVVTDLLDVCLFVQDIDLKNLDHEKTVSHYQELLGKHGITVGQIIPYRQLRAEYKQFEALRQLSSAFELFLADGRLSKMLPSALGKKFLKKRKLPLLVNFENKDLGREIHKALAKTTLTINGRGNVLSSQAGNIDMEDEHVAENVMSMIDQLESIIPGGWNNIAAVHLKLSFSKAIPIYLSTVSPKDQTVPCTIPAAPEPIIDDLNTLSESKIKIFLSGDVELIPDEKSEINNEITEYEKLLIEESQMKLKRKSAARNRKNNKKNKVEANVLKARKDSLEIESSDGKKRKSPARKRKNNKRRKVEANVLKARNDSHEIESSDGKKRKLRMEIKTEKKDSAEVSSGDEFPAESKVFLKKKVKRENLPAATEKKFQKKIEKEKQENHIVDEPKEELIEELIRRAHGLRLKQRVPLIAPGLVRKNR